MNTTSIPSATMPGGVATRGHTGMRCLSSRLCSPGLAGRPIIQVEPLTAAAVRTSQLGQNCATNVACRLLRICTRGVAHKKLEYEITAILDALIKARLDGFLSEALQKPAK